ncbi:hypothetical protein K438DRAFT_1977318 [Mycena galopus ATCC 62051]|nr:hypothetical protein K438DRAFT_1977318 [Mycena galopus ATCC 62051]
MPLRSLAVARRDHITAVNAAASCQLCSSRSTPLLDASNLAFLHPPRNTALTVFESPASPIVVTRVCDDCYDQIYGLRSPCIAPWRPSSPSRANSLLSSPIACSQAPLPHPRRPLLSFPPAASPAPAPAPPLRAPSVPPPSPPSPTSSYGELDAYPLHRASLLCKASGGGRWETKPGVADPALRVPVVGGKAPYELEMEREMEREEAEEKQRRSNPVIRDGDFQYRFPVMCEPEPIILERPPLQLSTF